MSDAADVLIIGGGVIGLTTACELARAGKHVMVCDKGPLGREASWAGAGIIPPGNFKRATSPDESLRALSSTLFAELSAWLEHMTGVNPGYRVCGGIEFFPTDGDPPPIQDWTRQGIAWEACDLESLAHLEPQLAAPPARSIHFPGLAQVRSPRLIQALIAAATRLGVILCPQRMINGFSISGRQITAADASGGAVFASQYLVCAGAWSRRLLGALRLTLPLFPVRGQMLLLKLPSPPISRVVIVGPRYLVPRDDGRVLVGSTEDHVGFNRKTVAADLEQLHEFALRLVPALGSAKVEGSWAGLRPGTHDGLPFLGPIPGFENAWIASGHFRSGIHLAPGTAKIMTQLICGDKSIIPVDEFRVDRPKCSAVRPAFRS
jgi:glycine oxidase